MATDRILQSMLTLAQAGDDVGGTIVDHLIAAVLFSAIGLVVFALGIWIIEKLTPFSVRKEIEEDQNTALAVVVGSMIIGISIVIAAAIHG